MRKQHNLCGILALWGIAAGCRSIPEKKSTQTPYHSEITRCIGLGPYVEDIDLPAQNKRYDALLKKCNLSMWAKIPVQVEVDKPIAIQIPKDGLRHALPCVPVSSWIGHLEENLIVKCVGTHAWIFWVGQRLNTYFRVSSILYDGHSAAEYVIKNGNSLDSFWYVDRGPHLLFVGSETDDY